MSSTTPIRPSASHTEAGALEQHVPNHSGYYAPHGGHPPQTDLLTDRAMFTEAYAVLPRGVMRDIVTSNLPFWDRDPAVGDRPAAVRLRRDVLPVHRRGLPRRRQ